MYQTWIGIFAAGVVIFLIGGAISEFRLKKAPIILIIVGLLTALISLIVLHLGQF